MCNANPVCCKTQPLKELCDLNLTIPDYQRPYEWKEEHVKHLLNDTYNAFIKKPNRSYLLGTIILHEIEDNQGNKNFNIVDGQQRLTTLAILLFECKKNLCEKNLPEIKTNEANKNSLLDQPFSHAISKYHIKKNQALICNHLKDKTVKSFLDFLLNCVVFTVLTLPKSDSLDLAYTFFDSNNSKGLVLSDFDLLKAHHLMFIPDQQENLARAHNDFWQEQDEHHNHLFSKLLRRIRLWSRGKDRDNKSERCNYDEYVSIVEPEDLEEDEHFFNRYMQPSLFHSWYRRGDQLVLLQDAPARPPEEAIPMEIPQTIIGGDAFFLYARRYYGLYRHLYQQENSPSSAVVFLRNLRNSFCNDYLKNAFEAVMLLYFDKFGENRLIEACTCVEMIISNKRYTAGSLRIEGTLTHVRDHQLIPLILEATVASHVISHLLDKCMKLSRPVEMTGRKEAFYCSIRFFYQQHAGKIHNSKIQNRLEAIYLGSQEKESK